MYKLRKIPRTCLPTTTKTWSHKVDLVQNKTNKFISISLVLISTPLYSAQDSQIGHRRTTYVGNQQTILERNPQDYPKYIQSNTNPYQSRYPALPVYNPQTGCSINERCCPCAVQKQNEQGRPNPYVPLSVQSLAPTPTVQSADEDDYQDQPQAQQSNVDSNFGNIQNRAGEPGSMNSQDRWDTHETRRRPALVAPAPVVESPQFTAMTQFGVKLFKLLNKPGNTVVSPLSVATSLALLQQGAKGQTLQELVGALQMNPQQALNSYGRAAGAMLADQSSILEVISKVLITNQFSIVGDFQRIAKDYFGSEIEKIHPESIERDRALINRWVANKTHNYIQQLLKPGSISENSQMILVNAVYFKGFWKRVFDVRNTADLDFTLSNGRKKPAPFMRMREMFQAGTDEETNAQVLTLPFKDDKYSLMVIVPKNLQDMDRVIASLDDVKRLLKYLNFPMVEARVSIPKFNIKFNSELKEPFKKMGIEQLFTYRTDLSGVVQEPLPGVTSAIHTAVLTIDEQGGTGAASTLINVETLSAIDRTITFTANQPFLAIVWEYEPVARPLFIAKIEDPTATVRF